MRIIYSPDKYILEKQVLTEVWQWQQEHRSIKFKERIYVVAPDDRGFSLESHYLDLVPKGSLLLADILSLPRLSMRFGEEIGGCKQKFLEKTGQVTLLSNILTQNEDKLPQLGRLRHQRGYLHELADILAEIRFLDLKGDDFGKALEGLGLLSSKALLQAKFAEWALLLNIYEAELARLDLVDHGSRLYFLQNLLTTCVGYASSGLDPEAWPFPYNRLSYITKAKFWFLGLGEERQLSPQEWQIIVSLASLGAEVNLAIWTDCLPITARITDSPYYYGHVLAARCLETFNDVATCCVAPDDSFVNLDKRMQIIAKAKDYREEAQLAVAEAHRLHIEEGIPFKDMGLAYTNAAVLPYLKIALNELNLPSFIEHDLKLSHAPLIAFWFALIEVYKSNWRLDHVLVLLKSTLWDIDPELVDGFENFCLARGINHSLIFNRKRYISNWRQALYYNANNAADMDGEMPDLLTAVDAFSEGETIYWDLVTGYLIPINEALSKLPEVATPPVFVSLCQDLIGQLNLKTKLENLMVKAETHNLNNLKFLAERGYSEFIKAGQRLIALTGNQTITLAQFVESLSDVFLNTGFSNLPTHVEQLDCGNLRSILAGRYRVIFVLGVETVNFPLSLNSVNLLKDTERELLNQFLTTKLPLVQKNYFSQKLAIEAQLNQAYQERLYLMYLGEDLALYAQNLRGGPNCREVDLAQYQTLKQFYYQTTDSNANTDTIIKEMLAGLKNNELQRSINLPPEFVTKLLPQDLSFSISRLEKFRTCPYQFFIDHYLMARDRLIWQPQAADQGLLLHKVLEIFFEELKTAATPQMTAAQLQQSLLDNFNLWQNYDLRQRQEISETYIQKAIQADDSLSLFNEKAIHSSVTRQVRQRLTQVLPTALQYLLNENWQPFAFEWRFGFLKQARPLEFSTTFGPNIKLRGIIDRIDVDNLDRPCNFTVVDYKLGERHIDYDKIYQGLSLQLPTYLLAIKNAYPHLKPARAAYFILKKQRTILQGPSSNLNGYRDNMAAKMEMTKGLETGDLELLMQKTAENIKTIAGDILSGKNEVRSCGFGQPEHLQGRICQYEALAAFDQPTVKEFLTGPLAVDVESKKRIEHIKAILNAEFNRSEPNSDIDSENGDLNE